MLTGGGIERAAIGADWLVAPAGTLKMSDAIFLRREPLEKSLRYSLIACFLSRLEFHLRYKQYTRLCFLESAPAMVVTIVIALLSYPVSWQRSQLRPLFPMT